jgi:hypothetical protein
MKIRPAKGWAIHGECGFYTGWWFTRAAAIAAHLHIKTGGLISEHPVKGVLDKEQAAAWKVCQHKGDRALKICIQER